jgi:hypothetical protein
MPYDFIEESARVKQSCVDLSITPTSRFLVILIEKQEMALLEKGKISAVFAILHLKKSPFMPR